MERYKPLDLPLIKGLDLRPAVIKQAEAAGEPLAPVIEAYNKTRPEPVPLRRRIPTAPILPR